MDAELDHIANLEDKVYQARRGVKIGGFVLALGIIMFIFNTIENQLTKGIFIGAGAAYALISNNRYKKTMNDLDTICSNKYGKSYRESLADIAEDRSKSARPFL